MATRPADISEDLYAGASDDGTFAGLRMTVDEFLDLPDDGNKYELIDGVVMMSPRAKPPHQRAAAEIFYQLETHCRKSKAGMPFFEVDVVLGEGPNGKPLVYAPDVIFIRAERVHLMQHAVKGAPDLAVEVISRGSRRMDTITKRNDFERFGVHEYWIIDPARSAVTFLRLNGGRYVEVPPASDKVQSEAVPGFELDVAAVRATFKPW